MSTPAATAVILVAAGRGTRMGEGLPKQWRPLAGRPVLAHTIDAFRAAGLERIVLAVHPEDRPRAAALGVPMVDGGATRAQSVRAALEWLAQDPPETVLIHDGARPLVPTAVIDAVREALQQHEAAAPALPVTDALWHGRDGKVSGVQSRDGLFRAQTPQGFRFAPILAAHRALAGDAADDVEVARAAGLDVWITPGSEDNLKLTYPIDFERAERLLLERMTIKSQTKGSTMDIRTGNGFDVHAFTEGDHVWLCGVQVPHNRALLGHSDADVGMHALTDAIYGALAEGDIGRHFPPSDPQWKGAASHIFLRHAAELARRRGFAITNCDVTLICERPKVGPHAEAMRAALAGIMGVDIGRISVKATTSERLGFTGREEGIAAIATATLVQE
ncbi:MAG: bifunctional 2-C-methyl-D-erythritol 4-phosphate cytidylyltransferase/2-C-methyl-D-erythritol 2,4-cyclodiphosphate synthase [Rhodobacter sp.]|nr:bifunctional 2-C-methyl-D-erythritol 4-phosphate cytidylyltransferase/2-C-methyl-D-erythritol 2,4-cyclodiphosphate synthase [Paracoccaceae bacterium]MCC0076728.1 bifunctional 2-C-methyl-D-erythritol 4-phosphate cytidylyltransferase/2-C-methyl-D-erythritol 2,4-cyclodiphosphate synthase [Rhodobacter sp.]